MAVCEADAGAVAGEEGILRAVAATDEAVIIVVAALGDISALRDQDSLSLDKIVDILDPVYAVVRRLEIGAFKPHAAEALAEYLADGVNGVRKEEYRLTLELDFKYRRGLVHAVVIHTLGKVSRQDILVGDKHFNGRVAEWSFRNLTFGYALLILLLMRAVQGSLCG